MARVASLFRRFLGFSQSSQIAPSITHDFSVFEEGDRVIVQGKKQLLTNPLRKNQRFNAPHGTLDHNSIIGKRPRDVVQARGGPGYRITFPTLEEYVALTPRKVTPVYGADAGLIVSLLDIHVSPPTSSNEGPQLEILEAGTGHGSLTLHLARAIHAANPPPPALPPPPQTQRHGESHEQKKSPSSTPSNSSRDGAPPSQSSSTMDTTTQQWNIYRSTRRAIIHSIDISPSVSAHASKIIRGFRRGLYAAHIDLHVGNVSDWLRSQTQSRMARSLLSRSHTDPFLTYVLLDLPSAHLQITNVAPLMHVDGILAVFVPSITQIGDCLRVINEQRLPFALEKAVELGTGISSGRLWDVRYVTKRTSSNDAGVVERRHQVAKNKDQEKGEVEDEQEEDETSANEAPSDPGVEEKAETEQQPRDTAGEEVMVCRPKVGVRIVGGGFVGIWRRIRRD